MPLIRKEDLFRKKEPIDREDVPEFSGKDRFAMIIAALWIILPYFFLIMAGMFLFVLFIIYIYG